ncbi:hypothetical protein, partial [Candidatus Kuenenia stuttgartiensis]|uniref:hypothetical protein n=1 Tax=Kuenenia stuttgartiensis TaxID=174633 RepID=UPI001B8C22F8
IDARGMDIHSFCLCHRFHAIYADVLQPDKARICFVGFFNDGCRRLKSFLGAVVASTIHTSFIFVIPCAIAAVVAQEVKYSLDCYPSCCRAICFFILTV